MNSSTKYLDKAILNNQTLITKEVIDGVKMYCGFFAFIHGIVNDDRLDIDAKIDLIRNLIASSIKFMIRKYEVDLELYYKEVNDNGSDSSKFESLAKKPTQMREDFEIGIHEAERCLYIEANDILKILKVDIEL